MASHEAKGSTKILHYFLVVLPIKSSRIMGLKGIHYPEALKHQAGLSFCSWCVKEGQNEDTMVNHLCTRHYHLRLVCKRCLQQFMTSSDRIQHHLQGCKSMCVPDDEESDWSQWLSTTESWTDPISATHKSKILTKHKVKIKIYYSINYYLCSLTCTVWNDSTNGIYMQRWWWVKWYFYDFNKNFQNTVYLSL